MQNDFDDTTVVDLTKATTEQRIIIAAIFEKKYLDYVREFVFKKCFFTTTGAYDVNHAHSLKYDPSKKIITPEKFIKKYAKSKK